MRWAVHIAHMGEMISDYRILTGNPPKRKYKLGWWNWLGIVSNGRAVYQNFEPWGCTTREFVNSLFC